MICHNCGAENTEREKVGREQTCSGCNAWLHCCLNCRFYAPGAAQQCRETEADYVGNKKGANFCEYFTPADSPSAKDASRAEEARQRLKDLFGD